MSKRTIVGGEYEESRWSFGRWFGAGILKLSGGAPMGQRVGKSRPCRPMTRLEIESPGAIGHLQEPLSVHRKSSQKKVVVPQNFLTKPNWKFVPIYRRNQD
jgi:hypothetical protein